MIEHGKDHRNDPVASLSSLCAFGAYPRHIPMRWQEKTGSYPNHHIHVLNLPRKGRIFPGPFMRKAPTPLYWQIGLHGFRKKSHDNISIRR